MTLLHDQKVKTANYYAGNCLHPSLFTNNVIQKCSKITTLLCYQFFRFMFFF